MPHNQFTKMSKKKTVKSSSNYNGGHQQKTLFQTWGSKISNCPQPIPEKTNESFQFSFDCNNNSNNNNDDDVMEIEDEDEILMQALEQTTNLNDQIGTTSFDCFENETSKIDLTSIPDLPGFEKSAGTKWIYPTNYPVRTYQYEIVKSALFQNTLVALPTGLGKTFIAAVVMFNFYRWYPLSKIVFMAPTKPLVTQQIEACYNIMGIPQSDIAEMTGQMAPVTRQKAWMEKRIIFLTPQVLANDLSRGTCKADKIKCLVLDEAHKSVGNYSYCQVVRELVKVTRDFRILALTATPGSNISMVQDVISNLLISHIELRTDDSPEIKMYSFERKVEKIIVPLGDELRNVEKQYLKVLESIVNRLVNRKVLYKRNVQSLSKFIILKCRDEFRQNPPSHLQSSMMGVIEGDFSLAMSLYHGYELLQLHGLRSFYQFLLSLVNGEKGYARTRSELMKNQDFINVYDYLGNKFGEKPSITFTQQSSQEKAEEYVIGHPKLEKLQEIVLDHFRSFQKDTRVMIFSQYRNSVTDITEMLKRQQPLVKVISFMGQAVKKETKAFTQKEQLKVMKQFREGDFNTLVCTCIGEEGFDIGDVDLIICFDASKSPVRLVQRMGRTGRKRNGRIVMLVTEGKEDQIYKQGQYNKNRINKALMSSTKTLRFYQQNPRMLPEGLIPKCHQMFINIKNEFESLEKAKMKKKEKKKTNLLKSKAKSKKSDVILEKPLFNQRLSPVSTSNSSIQSSDFQPVTEDFCIDFENNEDITRTTKPSTYELLSDDDLPDLSQLSEAVYKPKKEKLYSKKVKKKQTKQENPKNKKFVKKRCESPLIQMFSAIDDSNSDFIDESEVVCNDSNNKIKTTQEVVNASIPSHSENHKSSSDNSINKCLVPLAPSINDITELMDSLKDPSYLRTSDNLFNLIDEWDKEFNDSIKQAVVSHDEKEKLSTTIPSILVSSPVKNLQEFTHFSPPKNDFSVFNKDSPESTNFVQSIDTGSPMGNYKLCDNSLTGLGLNKRRPFLEVLNSSELRKYQRLESPDKNIDEDILSVSICTNSPENRFKESKSPSNLLGNNSKLVTSDGDLFSPSFEDAVEKAGESCLFLEKEGQNKFSEPNIEQKLEITALENSVNSDGIFDEEDHPVFDLTTDIFSEDEVLEGKTFEKLACNKESLQNDSYEINKDILQNDPSKINSPKKAAALKNKDKKSDSTSTLSSLIVSFVNMDCQESVKYIKDKNDDLPQFDLGLDIDVLPPTPHLSKYPNSFSRTFQSNTCNSSTPISIPKQMTRAGNTTSKLDINLPDDSTPNQVVVVPDSTKKAKSGQTLALKTKNSAFPDEDEEEEYFGGFQCILPSVNMLEQLHQSTPILDKTNKSKKSFSSGFIAKEGTSFSHEKKADFSDISPKSQNLNLEFDEDNHFEDDVLILEEKQDEGDIFKSKVEFNGNQNISLSDKDNSFQSKKDELEFEEMHSQDDFQEVKIVRRKVLSFDKDKIAKNSKKKCSKVSFGLGKQTENFNGRQFLDEEAELSGSDNSSNEYSLDEIEDDHYEKSFINDFTLVEHTQNPVDMKAVYLQSVISPVAKHHGYKLKYQDSPNVSNVYSCPPKSSDEDDYEYDSFCVQSDDSSIAEMTVIEECVLPEKTRNSKKRQKHLNQKRKKRRIICPKSSSEDDEIIICPNDEGAKNILEYNKPKTTKAVLNDEEEIPCSKFGSSLNEEENDCNNPQPLVIFADSREISSAQDIISDLRIKHKLNVIVTKLEACDYVVSLRTGIERKILSDFVNGANHKKLIKRLQDLHEFYERPCLIIEKNPQKGADPKTVSRAVPQTKYVETLLSQLSLGSIRLLFSNNKSETCELLASLCHQENIKGMAICSNQELSDAEQQKFKFFLSLPKINYALAFKLCRNYKTINEFLQSSVSSIVASSKMSFTQANYLHRFLRRHFR